MKKEFVKTISPDGDDRLRIKIETQKGQVENVMVQFLKQDVPVTSCVLLLQPSTLARERYDDNEVSYCFRLVRIYDLDTKDILDQRVVCLLPFVPLMKNGPELTTKAEELLYNSALSRSDKADMRTVMTIFSGLISRELPRQLLARRRSHGGVCRV